MHPLHLQPNGKEVNIVLKPPVAVAVRRNPGFRGRALCTGSYADAETASAFFTIFRWRCLDY